MIPMTDVTIGDEVFAFTDCPKCGMVSFIPRTFLREAIRIRDRDAKDKDGNARKLDVYCPRGHVWNFLSISELAARNKPKAEPDEAKNRLIDVLMGKQEG